MMRHCISLLTIFTLSGCAAPTEFFPEDTATFIQPIIASGKFTQGRYLEQFPECFNPEPNENGEVAICMDPPPLALTFQIEDVVYGRLESSVIEIMTTDHFGLSSYRNLFGRDYLVNLYSDGAAFIMPRYEKHPLFRDSNESLVAEVWDEYGIPWLSCIPLSITKEFDVESLSQSVAKPLLDIDQEWLNEYKDMYIIEDGDIYPRYGIPVFRLKEALINIEASQYSVQCNEE